MKETDVGRLLAAAAPETVPTIGDLPDRARSLGRRLRMRRAVMMSGGAGVTAAAVVAAVVALGGFGAGDSHKPTVFPVGEGGSTTSALPSSSTNSATPQPTRTPPSKPGEVSDDAVADAKVLAALKAALPAADRGDLRLYRAGQNQAGYGAEFDAGSAVLDVSIGRYVQEKAGDTPTMCASDARHCTKGTATLQGHQVRWEYYNGGMSSPSINVYDTQGAIDYLVSVANAGSSPLTGLSVLKGVALNEGVAGALLAAWPQH